MVGDQVFAPDGSVQDVRVSHQYIPARCYKLHLDDGLVIKGDQHMAMMLQTKKWRDRLSQYNHFQGNGHRKRFRRSLVRRTAKELHEGTLLHRDGRQEYSVGNCAPVMYPWVDLPVPPYVMGIWYGTMTPTGRHSAVSRPVEMIRKKLRNLGFFVRVQKQKNGRPRMYFRPSIRESFLFADALPPDMIPTQYVHASIEQRQQLLEGLLDSMFFRKYKNSIRYVASMAVYKEARLFQELIEGLGYRSVLSVHSQTGSYMLSFMFDCANPRYSRRFLTKIVTTEPVQCCHLLADQPILVGEGFIPVC
jgi:replicative DNA helicase